MKSSSTNKRPVRVGLISLGCAKNLVDAEIMLGSLMKGGIEITNDAAEADVVIVNTCSFIDSAQEESVDTILQSDELREAKNRGQGLIVSGCLPQRFREELPKLLPEVDAFMGIDQVEQVPQIVQQAIAHRAERLANPPPKRSRKKLIAKVQELDKAKPKDHEHAEARGDARPPTTVEPISNVALRPRYIPNYETPRFRLTPKHFAYVKIAEGCN